ncbi:RagB/SusD family nutrient uptake outer membrane protein [Psychroflexus sp. S27]|uniref:RagB/SusD family nutrient uptake outer membrane protein n=1 Tax=Psychroflexus sp. S27 TaxID=1982757 RepID=UPI000C29F31C|nr:RagB/SusD family nutrient uptake outer membrane protein [Psychroflexus sp. S27]PJX21864.1 RagB/SusD family nutrient uptake outer membrane protein [Psychroflexus sp. S27]
MKTLNKLFGAALVASLLFSCNDDFLETEPTEFISSDQIGDLSEQNPELQAANIKGIYALMYQRGTGGTLRHTDFGQKSYDIYGDLLSGNMVMGGLNYGWYSNVADLTMTTDYNDTENYEAWRYYYRLIFSANLMIEQLGGNDEIPEDEQAQVYYAQAKFFRGMSYFYLMNYFTEGYAPGTQGIPYYDVVSDAQPSIEQAELYGKLTDDLKQATQLLEGFDRGTIKNEVNQDVAESYLAYAYAAMGEDDLAATHSKNVIDRGNHPIMTAAEVSGTSAPAGFNDASTPGWIWGMDITLDQGLGLVSWWGQVDVYTYSYAYVGDPKSINAELLDEMPADDVRKSQFSDVFGSGQPAPVNKFFAEGRSLGGQRNITSDYIYLRMAEMYLLNAEASAKSGDEATAKTSLKAVVELRVNDATYIDALSGQDLLDEIYVQTRRELWGEGKSYLAMKRNEATVKYPTNHLTNAGETYQYNADELTFEFPIEEVQNNPNL